MNRNRTKKVPILLILRKFLQSYKKYGINVIEINHVTKFLLIKIVMNILKNYHNKYLRIFIDKSRIIISHNVWLISPNI